ncbi:hypothetical protein N9I56_03985 [Alphaproteobacteria bacterium]|nr:hypothetical protein [Alphaproteobacteria bacterium]
MISNVDLVGRGHPVTRTGASVPGKEERLLNPSAKSGNDEVEGSLTNNNKNFVVQAKKLAKLSSTLKAYENISNYASLIDKAHDTLRALEERLIRIKSLINAAAGVSDNEDYQTRSVGAIQEVRVEGVSSGQEVYQNIGQFKTSGSGRGAQFSISSDGVGNYTLKDIGNAGSGYEPGDILTVLGTSLGGVAPGNNLSLEVMAISPKTVLQKTVIDATDDIDRMSLELNANILVDEISAIINGSSHKNKAIFSGIFAKSKAQIGYQQPETKQVDVQELSTQHLGQVLNSSFVNSDFSIIEDTEGTLLVEQGITTSGNVVSLHGWDIGLSQVSLAPFDIGSDAAAGSIVTDLGGFSTAIDSSPTPALDSDPASNSRGDDYHLTDGNFSYSINSGTLNLSTDNVSVGVGSVIHGPYLISQNAVRINAGDQVSFNWSADVGEDAFDVFAYLLNVDDGSTIELLNQSGTSNTAWTSASSTLVSSGDFKLVFVSGTYDENQKGQIGNYTSSGTSIVDGLTGASVFAGSATGSSIYSGVMQSSTNGSGSGAVFNISSDSFLNYQPPTIISPGSGYEISDIITISGASLGGVDGVNDLTLQVSSIGVSKNFFDVVQSSSSDVGSGSSFNVSLDGAGNYIVNSTSSRGLNYSVGEVINISGVSLGGDPGTHDLSITVSDLQANAGAKLYVKDVNIIRANQTPTLLDGLNISSTTSANEARDVIASALEQVRYRDAYLSSKKTAMLNQAVIDNAPQLKSYYDSAIRIDTLPKFSIREIKKNLIIDHIRTQIHDVQYLISLGISDNLQMA